MGIAADAFHLSKPHIDEYQHHYPYRHREQQRHKHQLNAYRCQRTIPQSMQHHRYGEKTHKP